MRVPGARTQVLWLFASLALTVPGYIYAQENSGDSEAADSAPSTEDEANEPPNAEPPSNSEEKAGAQAPDSEDSPSPSEEITEAPSEDGSSEDVTTSSEEDTSTETATEPISEDAHEPGVEVSAEELSAEEYAQSGRVFYGKGDYVSALEAFRTAFQTTPTSALAYNIARCHERLSQWSQSIEWYEKYAELESNPRDRADALNKADLLRAKIGEGGADPYEMHMVSGRTSYSRGDFEGAIEDFRAAFDIRPDADPLYNIAKSYEKMARYDDALDFYQQYLELAPNAADRSDVEAIMARLRRDLKSRFQELSISSNPPGADVYLDDRNEGIIGQTNLRAKIKPGPHTIYIDLNGYEPIKREFIMPDDSQLNLDFNLVALTNVGYVTFNIDQPGARIFVDGAIIGLSPFTQKKAISAGKHQVQVELVGFNRATQTFEVKRNAESTLNIYLEKYNPPISDGTLADWGRNLIIFGLASGALGVGGPIIYQELEGGRYFDELGPRDRSGPIYSGNNLRTNNELQTLQTIQLASGIASGVMVASGLTFYLYKWFRKTPPPPVTAYQYSPLVPTVKLTGVGMAPLPSGGGTFGLQGRF